jgi:hypothetical protein
MNFILMSNEGDLVYPKLTNNWGTGILPHLNLDASHNFRPRQDHRLALGQSTQSVIPRSSREPSSHLMNGASRLITDQHLHSGGRCSPVDPHSIDETRGRIESG